MATETNTDPGLLARFREEVDTYLLTIQQDLVALEQDTHNDELMREMMRAAHTVKGAGQMMGFRQIARVMHGVENIMEALKAGNLSVSPELSDLLFEALDSVDIMTKAQVNLQELPLDPENLIRQLDQALQSETDVTTPSSDGGGPEASPSANVGLIVAAQPADDRVRVSIERLDGLMQLAGEMVISKMQSERAIEEMQALRNVLRRRHRQAVALRERVAREWGNLNQSDVETELDQMGELDDSLEDINKTSLQGLEQFHAHLENITDELQETVLELRMTPVETIFRQFIRTVRDLAKERGKQVNLFTLGGETEVDKRVLDALNEALIHLVRNSLDHGIETAEQRTKTGKIPIGQIMIRAAYQGGQAVVEVSDDGAGIDVERLKQLAVQRGIIAAAEAERMGDEDARQLIFYPGFSTAALITDTSGRGVGMEIVQRVISKLGGSVDLQSELGKGTTVILRLPISLSAIRALLIRAHGQLFALATNSTEDLAYIGVEDIIMLEGREAIRMRERTVPLFRLAEALELNRSRAEQINRRWLEVRDETGYEQMFDAIFGVSETSNPAASPKPPTAPTNSQNGAKLSLNGSGRTGVSSLYGAGYAIQVEGKRPVMVMKSSEKYIAFLVDELVDEREIVVKRLNPLLSRVEWVAGTTVLGDGSIVIILDGPALINRTRARTNRLRASGQSSGVAATWRQEAARPHKSLLVVDDSVTTRELERSILEAAGYNVDVAVDGVEALEMLALRKYALAIVDVEMPRMDGFTLTERIKANSDLNAMPVIIVSSLGNEAYKRRGIEVGAQAYITKGQFDQNNLLDTIELLSNR